MLWADVLTVIGIFLLLVGFWVAGYFMRRNYKRRQHAAELRAPLLNSTEHRLDAALREAEEGFNVCKLCGFENFKRFPFCNLCGGKILEHEEERLRVEDAKKKSWKRGKNSKKNGGYESLAGAESGALAPEPTQRQLRARKRKEWTRKLGADGALFWYRDGSTGADLRFPGSALLLQDSLSDAAVQSDIKDDDQVEVVVADAVPGTESITGDGADTSPSETEPDQEPAHRNETEAESVQRPSPATAVHVTPQDRGRELQQLVSLLQLQVVDASAANPALLPLVSASDTHLQWRDVLSLAQQTFPAKYAHFVTLTAGLIVPSERELIKLNLRREHLLEDSIESLTIIPAKNIRSGMRIHFVGEAGVDAGGLHREWFVLVNELLVDPSCGVFQCMNKDEQTFFLNANSHHDLGENHLVYFYSAGRFVGRALLEGCAMGFHLSFPLLKIILGIPMTFSDLQYFDPEAYRGLLWLVENDGVDALGLDFSVTEKRGDDIVVIDLVPDGRNIDVTDANKDEYLRRRVQFTLFESVSSQMFVFLKGLYEVIPQELLMLFDPEEFDYLLCGSDEIDVDDWEKHTKYTLELHEHRAMIWFWEIVREMPNEYRRRLLHFATGSSRVPIAGFSGLTSYDGKLCPFTLKGVRLEDDGYIWSHACFNRLDLPLHVIRDELKAVVYAAVETDTYGFTTS